MATTSQTTASDVQVTGELDMRGNTLSGLNTNTTEYPLLDGQGTSKIYVDEQRDYIVANLPVLVDNGSF